jgi:hypothetical protein
MNTKVLFTLFGVLLVGSIFYFLWSNSTPWMLSLYRNNQTIMRIDYESKDACLSAGRSYLSDQSADRIDCGYKCKSFNKVDLQSSPICESVCNDAGCRQ